VNWAVNSTLKRTSGPTGRALWRCAEGLPLSPQHSPSKRTPGALLLCASLLTFVLLNSSAYRCSEATVSRFTSSLGIGPEKSSWPPARRGYDPSHRKLVGQLKLSAQYCNQTITLIEIAHIVVTPFNASLWTAIVAINLWHVSWLFCSLCGTAALFVRRGRKRARGATSLSSRGVRRVVLGAVLSACPSRDSGDAYRFFESGMDQSWAVAKNLPPAGRTRHDTRLTCLWRSQILRARSSIALR
jgi:hypothetical protein